MRGTAHYALRVDDKNKRIVFGATKRMREMKAHLMGQPVKVLNHLLHVFKTHGQSWRESYPKGQRVKDIEKRIGELGDLICMPPTGFFPVQGVREEERRAIDTLVDKFYRRNFMDRADTSFIKWSAYARRRHKRFLPLSSQGASALLRNRELNAKHVLSAYDDALHPTSRAELSKIRRELCTKPQEWNSRTGTSKQANRIKNDTTDVQFVLGMQEYLESLTIAGKDGVLIEPFAQRLVINPTLSWNPVANMAFMVCCMFHSTAVCPLRFVLNKEVPAESRKGGETDDRQEHWTDAQFDSTPPPDARHFKGVLTVSYLDDTADDTIEGFKFKPTRCTVVPMLVYDDPQSFGASQYEHLFFTKYALFSLGGRRIDWGDHVERKRILYYETRQVMSYSRMGKDLRWYTYVKDDALDPRRHENLLVTRLSRPELESEHDRLIRENARQSKSSSSERSLVDTRQRRLRTVAELLDRSRCKRVALLWYDELENIVRKRTTMKSYTFKDVPRSKMTVVEVARDFDEQDTFGIKFRDMILTVVPHEDLDGWNRQRFLDKVDVDSLHDLYDVTTHPEAYETTPLRRRSISGGGEDAGSIETTPSRNSRESGSKSDASQKRKGTNSLLPNRTRSGSCPPTAKLIEYRKSIERMGRLRADAIGRGLPWKDAYNEALADVQISVHRITEEQLRNVVRVNEVGAFEEGMHSVHRHSSTQRTYIDGITLKRPEDTNYISMYGMAYSTAARMLASRFQHHPRWFVIAHSLNFTDAALNDGNACVVDLWLLGETSVDVLARMVRAHPHRLRALPVGQLMHPIPSTTTISPKSDITVFDVYSLRDYPRIVNLLCAFQECVDGVLVRGGMAVMFIAAPRREGDLLWLLLRYLLCANFEWFDIHVELDVPTQTVPTLRIFAGDYAPIGATKHPWFSETRGKLMLGEYLGYDMYAPDTSTAHVPRLPNKASVAKLADLYERSIRKSYDDMTSTVNGLSKRMASALAIPLPRVISLRKRQCSSLPVPAQLLGEVLNDRLQLSWRDVVIESLPRQNDNVIFKNIPHNRMPYIEDARDYEPRCHWGQLKLLASEWDFLNACREELGGRPMLVVYAGSADGMHIPILADLFPEIRIHAYDGRPFHDTMYIHDRIRVFQGRDGYVTDGAMPRILETARRAMGPRHALVFISDIRGSRTDNVSVHLDMMSQARWCGMLQAERSLLKFRLPYPLPDGSTGIESAKPEDFYRLVSKPVFCDKEHQALASPYLYLEGEIRPQLFAPMYSTETRLIVRPPLAVRYYDPLAYEQQMNAYNVQTRRTSYPENPPVDLYLPGHDRAHESAVLFAIADAYVRYQIRWSGAMPPSYPEILLSLKDDDPDGGVFRKSVRLLFQIEKRLQEASGQLDRTLASCATRTFLEYSADLKHKFLKKNRAAEYNAVIKDRITAWKSIVKKQTGQMLTLSVQRMMKHAIPAGILTESEAVEWAEKISSSSTLDYDAEHAFRSSGREPE